MLINKLLKEYPAGSDYKLYSDVTDIYLFDSKGYEKSQSFDHDLIKNIKLNKELMIAGNIQYNDDLENYKNLANYIDLSFLLVAL